MGKVIVEIEGLSKRFCRRPEYAMRYAAQDIWRELRGMPPADSLRPGEFWALRDIDMQLEQGEVLGIIGHNGAGKSTLINLISGLIRPTRGSIRLYTDRVALMDNQGGLNMVETGRENIAIQLALNGCPDDRIADESELAIAFAELGDFIDAAVGTYSLGMRLRLAFSIYTRLKPDLFIVDEAISGGDMRFRHRFQKYLRNYIDGGGSILFCSHEFFLVQTLCRRCVLMDKGCLRICGNTLDVLQIYQDIMEQNTPTDETASTELSEQQLADEAELFREAIQNTTSDAASADEESTRQSAPLLKVVNKVNQADMPVIESLTLTPINGDELLPGKGVMLELTVSSPGTFDKIVWSTEIGQGTLSAITTIVGGLTEQKFALKPGRNILRGRIEQFPLAPGKYDVRTTIAEVDSGAILVWRGYENAALSIQVTNPADKVASIMTYRKNIVHVNAVWSQQE